MNMTKHAIKRTAIATAVTATLGMTAISAAADLTFSFSGWFTMINPVGTGALNNSDAAGQGYDGWRTAVTGTMDFDTVAGTGSGSIIPFSFFAAGNASATGISFQAIGNGAGGAGPLVLGNMGFNWGGTFGIPVSIVLDGSGLFTAINGGLTVGDTIGVGCTGCVDAATEDFLFGAKASYTLPMGPIPVATTTWNTADIGAITLGANPSGTLPLTDDGIGGSPMKAGPFPSFNANFDFTSLTLQSDGSGSITAPANISNTVPQVPGPPKSLSVSLGVPTNVTPAGTPQYCTETKATCDANNSWVDSGTTGANNPIDAPVTETINTLVVNWRAPGGAAFSIQNVTTTVDDTTAPVITSTPMDVNVNVESTNEEICFTNDTIGHLTATDVWDSAPDILYSLNGFDFVTSNPAEDCSDRFGPNANTVFWRAVDTAGNISSYEQTVTLNLPSGIIGKACEVNLEYDGVRLLAGNFIMRNPNGSQVGVTDNTVTGDINTTLLCTEQGTDICPDVGASLVTTQPFEGLLWKAEPVWLYGPGDWTFETCPGDNSSQCDNNPRPLGMTVLDATQNNGVPQLGAHMLFEWGNTQSIDVVVVWDVDCAENQLTTTDPATPPNSTYPNGVPPDGILGTPMVDGPFIGFNAAFDQSATGVDASGNSVPLIAEGGYLTSIPAYRNPNLGSSPLPLDFTKLDASDFPKDPRAVESCVGGCYSFETGGLIDATDNNGNYKFAQVVLPLDNTIPFWSLYRKFDEASNQWKTFVPDNRNSITLAAKNDNGFCPEPGSPSYKVASFNSQMAYKLEEGANCVQITIENNGPYDSNPANDKVADPSGVASVSSPGLEDPKSSSGGCSIGSGQVEPAQRGEWWLLSGLLAYLGWRRRKQQH